MTWTELHDACEHQDAQRIIKAAYQHCENALQVDEKGWTPLHFLCWGNPSLEAVRALLDACPQSAADRDAHGNTPLHVACACKETDPQLVQELLKVGPTAAATPNKEGLMPLHMACRYAPSNMKVIEILVNAHPEALRTHIKIGDRVIQSHDVLTSTTNTGHAVLDPSGGMATHSSAEYRFDAIRHQIRDGAYPLHMAVSGMNDQVSMEVIELLVGKAPEVLLQTNKLGETPLHVALKHLDLVEAPVIEYMILKEPRALSIQDKAKGNTPIHTIASQDIFSERIIEAMIHARNDLVSLLNRDGFAPVDLAKENKCCGDQVIEVMQRYTSQHS